MSKDILDRVNSAIRVSTGARQWRSNQEVTAWFDNIEEKGKKTFVKFDIVEFYPSITEATFRKAIDYAKEFTDITNDEMEILLNARESFVCLGSEVWAKKGQKTFDVTMGAFDGAEVAELVGLLILRDVKPLFLQLGFTGMTGWLCPTSLGRSWQGWRRTSTRPSRSWGSASLWR